MLCMMSYRHCADTLINVRPTINRIGQNLDRFSELVYGSNCKHCATLNCILGLCRRLTSHFIHFRSTDVIYIYGPLISLSGVSYRIWGHREGGCSRRDADGGSGRCGICGAAHVIAYCQQSQINKSKTFTYLARFPWYSHSQQSRRPVTVWCGWDARQMVHTCLTFRTGGKIFAKKRGHAHSNNRKLQLAEGSFGLLNYSRKDWTFHQMNLYGRCREPRCIL